jgi:hypothetical protein
VLFKAGSRGPLREPTVRDLTRTDERGWGVRPEPDGDRALERKRSDAGADDVFVLAVERNRRSGPQFPKERDLFDEPLAAVGEILAEGFVLDGVPTDRGG